MIGSFSPFLMPLLIFIALVGMLGCGNSSPPALATMVEEVRAGVVRIETSDGSGGSGVIFSTTPGGGALVLTNYHVVEDADRINIEVTDSATYEGHLRGFDADIDLAVVSICCGDFLSLGFGDGSSIKPGNEVITMGYPTDLPGGASVTRGIVSAIRSEGDYEIIQMDAPINPGNSGGPLLSLSGRVLGINAYGYRDTEGLGFAISERTVQAILPELMGTNNFAVATSNRTPSPTPRNTSTRVPWPTAKARPKATAWPTRIPTPTPRIAARPPRRPTATTKRISTPTLNPTATQRPWPTATPYPTPTPLAPPTLVPTATPPVVREDYFTRGSSQDDVLHAQGTPTEINSYPGLGEETWTYGRLSRVTFSLPEGQVTEWSNYDGNLKVRLLPATANSATPGYFTRGSSQATTWTYVSAGSPSPCPSHGGADGNLKVRLLPGPIRTPGYFTRGSSQDDVLHAQGTPTEINSYPGLGEETWTYGRLSRVTFSLPEGQVTEWSNYDGNLKVRLLPATANSATPGYFTRGSSQDDVLHAQGTPTEINSYPALGEETWTYGRLNQVTFSLPEGQVTEWNNYDGNLKVR